MFNRHFATLAVPAVTLGVLLGFAGCASEPETTAAAPAPKAGPTHAQIANDVSATAEVVALDKNLRLVTLRGEDGRLTEIYCSDEVRNFDQIVIGDSLRVRYRQSLGATLLPPGTPSAPAMGSAVSARAAKGAKPGAAVGIQASVRVKIVSVDGGQDVVVFSLPSGELVAHRVATPEGRAFVKGVHVGDLVQLDYSEALALTIEALKPAG